MKKIILPGLLAGLVMVVISALVGFLSNLAFPALGAEYSSSGIFRPWSDPLMYLIYLQPFILGILLAWAWHKTKRLFKGPAWKRGALFGLCFWLVASVPGMLISYSSFKLSLAMVLSWTLAGLLQALAAGMVLAKLNK